MLYTKQTFQVPSPPGTFRRFECLQSSRLHLPPVQLVYNEPLCLNNARGDKFYLKSTESFIKRNRSNCTNNDRLCISSKGVLQNSSQLAVSVIYEADEREEKKKKKNIFG